MLQTTTNKPVNLIHNVTLASPHSEDKAIETRYPAERPAQTRNLVAKRLRQLRAPAK